jgi:hypothetical protein
MRRLTQFAVLGVAIAVALTLSFAGPAAATPAITGSFPIDETFVDDGASAACGFPVTASNLGTARFEAFFDNTGTFVRLQVEENIVESFTANGITINGAGHTLTIISPNGDQTLVGLVIRVPLPGGGTLYLDRGRLVFDADGNLLSESGPHPSLHGDFDGLCAALTP